MKSRHNPDRETEARWQAEKERHYVALREAKLGRALEWLHHQDRQALHAHLKWVERKIGKAFAAELRRRYWKQEQSND